MTSITLDAFYSSVVLGFVLWTVLMMKVVSQLRIDITLNLAGAGFLGLAIGFGAHRRTNLGNGTLRGDLPATAA